MEKKVITKRYAELFEKLLSEKDEEKQKEIAEQIADLSGQVNDEVEEKYEDELICKIQKTCLSMEHWKDETGYCDLTEKDIEHFISQLKNLENN